ncbi:BatD family protein [Bosea caraganae]|nr:BatD family protein [Bosea caraganae]
MRLALPCLLLLPIAAMAQTTPDAPRLRTSLEPAAGIVIGQPVRLRVQVLFPGEMPHPPLVKVREAPGTQILRFETQALTIRDRIDGNDYVGQVFEFVVFPRRPGEIAIPAPDVTLLDRAGDPVGTATGEATRFGVSVPPGIDPSGPVLVADKVSASESWSPEPGSTLREGGAITRIIRRQASGVPALGMAELRFTAPEGVRVYLDPPVVEDRVDRGGVDGARTDKVTYVFERPGTYALPQISQPWWSLSSKEARIEALPGAMVTVAATSPAASERHRFDAGWLAWGLLGLVALVTAVAGGVTFVRPWRERYRASAAFAQRQLLRTAAFGDAAATYRAMQTWRSRMSLADMASLETDPSLLPHYQHLLAVIFGGIGSWGGRDGRALAKAVAAWRSEHPQAGGLPQPLPPLNPAYAPIADAAANRGRN